MIVDEQAEARLDPIASIDQTLSSAAGSDMAVSFSVSFADRRSAGIDLKQAARANSRAAQTARPAIISAMW